jgi:tRNA (mo5U34)-methyltransferase
MTREQIREAVDRNPVWYHSIELGNGIVTPGWFDLRPIVGRMPWPDVAGKRCLDVGTYDGFLSFELERRGASAVVAADVHEHEHWDWPHRTRALGPARLAEIAGEKKGLGFEIARDALGSAVEKRNRSIYDLDPAVDGTFDFVICGTLLLHLRDPIRALERIRAVCAGCFLSAEQIDVRLSFLRPRQPVAHFRGGDRVQWWIPNRAAHRRMLEAAGFEITRVARPYRIPFGVSHPVGGRGLAHSALLAEPQSG